jgi:putative transposase
VGGVTVRYDPRDLAEIRVFHRGTFLCRAVAPELAAQTISLKDLQNARARRRRELRAQLTERRSLAEALTHPVPEAVPADAPLTPRTAAGPPPPAAPRPRRLKLYRED